MASLYRTATHAVMTAERRPPAGKSPTAVPYHFRMPTSARLLLQTIVVAIAIGAACAQAPADTYTVTLDPSARSEPATGRVILFFITRTERRWQFVSPISGPHFDAPQPIASIEVRDFKPGDSVVLDGRSLAFPDSLDKLDGKVRVQAILDADQTERSHEEGPGNVFSDEQTVELSAARDDRIALQLTHRIEHRDSRRRANLPNLKWVRFRSEILSKFYGRDVEHRAGVALPMGYIDPARTSRTHWPAIYVIPGFGGRDDDAEEYAHMLATKTIDTFAPVAVYIVLDPESPLGHHGFVDSPCNGPRETALIAELIPHLEKEFRLVAKPEARLLTGHSSGGWSSLWLQLRHPEIFGGCWSSSPDPIDFSAFQMTDLYHDSNMFKDCTGVETPSYRKFVGFDEPLKVLMTARQEAGMEYAIDPTGRSGQQWDAWNAMFSPKNDATNLPRRMFDPQTGAIDANVVKEWGKCDISRNVARNWNTLGPVVMNKVHIVCGDEDDYYLNRAVERFKDMVDRLTRESPQKSAGAESQGGAGGYIEIVPGASHHTIIAKTFQRFNSEMRDYLQRNGLQDRDDPARR
jgi:S-formylglutathione hydrolase FrmB